MCDVVVVGSANLDLVASTPRLPAPGETVTGEAYAEYAGGKGLNQAIAASRAGADVALVACVGRDSAAEHLLEVARIADVDISFVDRSDRLPTGRALIMVDRDAENSIVVVPGANQQVTASSIPTSRVVLAQLETPFESVVAAFEHGRANGSVTILNPAPAAHLPSELIALSDIIVPNEHEIELIGEIDPLLTAGVQAVIVTRGSRGVTITTAGPSHDSTTQVVPAIPVEAIDTTGAGDAFCGCLAAGLAAGLELDGAVRRAVAAGALATTVPGAVPSLPTSGQIDALLKG